jgi:predicted Zn-dependent protease
MVGVGARVSITGFLVCLAEAQTRARRIDDALSTIDEALQANPEELAYRPYMLTFRGDLWLKLGDFREAITLAQKMSAKTFELRATTSLARLLAQQGRLNEARAMLADIYNWFTEGFDTADSKDSKALLDALKG